MQTLLNLFWSIPLIRHLRCLVFLKGRGAEDARWGFAVVGKCLLVPNTDWEGWAWAVTRPSPQSFTGPLCLGKSVSLTLQNWTFQLFLEQILMGVAMRCEKCCVYCFCDRKLQIFKLLKSSFGEIIKVTSHVYLFLVFFILWNSSAMGSMPNILDIWYHNKDWRRLIYIKILLIICERPKKVSIYWKTNLHKM